MKPKTEEKHAPTPWFLDGKEVNGLNGGLIADCFDNNGSKEANAEFIVRAVNHYAGHDINPDCQCSHVIPEQIEKLQKSHEALLEVAKKAEKVLTDIWKAGDFNKDYPVIKELRKVIASVEKKP